MKDSRKAIRNIRIETMQDWQAEGLPKVVTNIKYHECGSECNCRLEKT